MDKIIYNSCHRKIETERELQMMYADSILSMQEGEKLQSFDEWLSGCYPTLVEITEENALQAAALLEKFESELQLTDLPNATAEEQRLHDAAWEKYYSKHLIIVYDNQSFIFHSGAQLHNAISGLCHEFITEQ